MSRRDTRTPEQRELDQRIAEINAEEERLDEMLTRREVLNAIEEAANRFGCFGSEAGDLIADAFRALGKALA